MNSQELIPIEPPKEKKDPVICRVPPVSDKDNYKM